MELSLGVQNILQDSNMKKIVFPMLVFALVVSACTAPTPTQTPIFTPVPNTPLPTLTAIPLPTETPLLSPTPTETLMPSPTPDANAELYAQQIVAWNERWNGAVTITENLTLVDRNGNALPETLVYDPKKDQITYTFDSEFAGPGFVQPINLNDIEFTYGADKKPKALKSISVWKWNAESKQLKRMKYVDSRNKETRVGVATKEEIIQEIIRDSSMLPEHTQFTGAYVSGMFKRHINMNNIIGNTYAYEFEDVVDVGSGGLWGDNQIPVLNEETGVYDIIKTGTYGVHGFKISGDYALIIWVGADGEDNVRIVKGKDLSIPAYFNDWYKTNRHTP
jgi:hypothetical protein